MKRSLIFRSLARRDLIEIWRYTAEKWDAIQADDYVARIDAELTNVACHPSLGTDRSDLHQGVRKATVGSHHIYYLFDDTTLDIVRILHQRQDAKSILRPQE